MNQRRKLMGAVGAATLAALLFAMGDDAMAAKAVAAAKESVGPVVNGPGVNGLGVSSAPGPGGSTQWTLPVETMVALTVLTFLPALLLMVTAFTRIVIVLSLLRQALGTPSIPPNQVLIGMSMFLTFFVMSPTIDVVVKDAYKPYAAGEITSNEAFSRAQLPLREFMLKHTRSDDIELFAKIADETVETPEAVSTRVLIPAFMTSELKTAFMIGFLVFIPFLIIDMIVASSLMSMGMMMVSPVMVSLPVKLAVFVLADGWGLMMSALADSFR